MAAVLSLTCEQVEMVCEIYHQTLTLASSLEMVQQKLPELKRLGQSDLRRLRPLREFLMIVKRRIESRQERGGEEGLTTKDLALRQDVTTRTIQDDLARLRELQLVQANSTVKGRWGKPHSRKITGSGHPPLRYVINPQLRGRDYIMDDNVEPSDRKFLSLAEKLLLSMPRFRAANERMMDAWLNILPQIPEFMSALNEKIPELRDLLLLLESLQVPIKPPPELETMKYKIGGEVADIARLRIPIGWEVKTLRIEERRRLQTLSA